MERFFITGMMVFMAATAVAEQAQQLPQEELIADIKPNMYDRQQIEDRQLYNQDSSGSSGNYYYNQDPSNSSYYYYSAPQQQQQNVPLRKQYDARYYNYDDATPGR